MKEPWKTNSPRQLPRKCMKSGTENMHNDFSVKG